MPCALPNRDLADLLLPVPVTLYLPKYSHIQRRNAIEGMPLRLRRNRFSPVLLKRRGINRMYAGTEVGCTRVPYNSGLRKFGRELAAWSNSPRTSSAVIRSGESRCKTVAGPIPCGLVRRGVLGR